MPTTIICIISIYRSPTGNFINFIRGVEAIMNRLYNNVINFIICGDVTITYLDSRRKKRQQLDTLPATYSLTSTVHFPTRVQNGSASIIDNIFIDASKNENYTICPLLNGLSDHDAQIIILNYLNTQGQYYETRTILSKRLYQMY